MKELPVLMTKYLIFLNICGPLYHYAWCDRWYGMEYNF